MLSTNLDKKGLEFVSTYEHRVKPIYAAQWHPEANSFEFGAFRLNEQHQQPESAPLVHIRRSRLEQNLSRELIIH